MRLTYFLLGSGATLAFDAIMKQGYLDTPRIIGFGLLLIGVALYEISPKKFDL